jgi:hypothetical protein
VLLLVRALKCSLRVFGMFYDAFAAWQKMSQLFALNRRQLVTHLMTSQKKEGVTVKSPGVGRCKSHSIHYSIFISCAPGKS